jgi:hypothetical protein
MKAQNCSISETVIVRYNREGHRIPATWKIQTFLWSRSGRLQEGRSSSAMAPGYLHTGLNVMAFDYKRQSASSTYWPMHWLSPIHEHVGMQAACPPTWLVAGFLGRYNDDDENSLDAGNLGRWGTSKTPPLTHFVGAPDKILNMKAAGFWNYDADALTAWTRVAYGALSKRWGESGDVAAAEDPFAEETRARLAEEGQELRAAMPQLADFRRECEITR